MKETLIIQAVQKEWKLSGEVLSEDSDNVVIQDEKGVFTVPKSRIIYRKKEDQGNVASSE